ncbi:uncharacterized protein MAM_07873 [Metarhizium album ARSEF 1941]|uniref:Centrosomin N-terminal motif 1 domain-containing protein n=1 Tax=Metarhizium album (strain ARSEF 1941) TaxID=1081103 RepID=A0A0B2WL95_METAS|nr:uncharacterized protein MAM_07873 [Metarhizium album ARSEF 1941]KHN94237.1 hypothetical protein MAM_07873 [Metarhizium album ARSEF 1941]
MSRPTPPLCRQESIESTRQVAHSSFLQEKLQKERRAESDKFNQSQSSLARSNPDMSLSADLGRAPNSPLKTSTEGTRPQSSAGVVQGKKKGLGVKEMEKVVSNLHKQNFDLKLELYHRRERQTTLEERVDALESDKQRMEEVNDKLLIELEKRDKAVEEAVAMIVNLEAKVDQLFRERAMVQQVEIEGFFCPRDYDTGCKTPVPQSATPDLTQLEEDAKVVNRMPSFLSDHSETTQNLRNVYLGTKASTLSLTRVAEGSPEADNVQELGSPTLSVLSESSFVSVYGRKEKVVRADKIAADIDEATVLDGGDSSHTKQVNGEQSERNHTRPVASSRRADSRATSTGKFKSITDVITGSPLGRPEQLDLSRGGGKESGRPRGQGKEYSKAQLLPDKLLGLKSAKDKRDALRGVTTTDGQGGVRLHDQALPPTPDTISSSMLRRFKSSNETLSQHDAADENGNGVVLSHLGGQGGGQRGSQLATIPNGPPEEAESWASPSKRAIDLLFEDRGPLIPRPRSADESTVSHRRGKGWDSDDDDDSDAHSLESSLDIWMRESAQPSRNESRVSPDLFGFPTDSAKGSWAMVTAFKPNGDLADNVSLPPGGFDRMPDLFSVRQGLFAGTAPPPPNRRSSLHARTGSTSEAATSQGTIIHGADQALSSTARRRSYHSRQNSVDLGRRDDMRTPVQKEQFASPPPPSSDQKPKHYPPITGQQHGARAGLNRLFRRSTSGAPPGPTSEQSTSGETTISEALKNVSTIGVPSWARRNSATEDDRSGATPPPIMLNPRQCRRNTMGAEGDTEKPPADDLGRSKTPGPAFAAVTPVTAPSADVENSPAAAGSSSSSTRRRWLPGFSRTNNSRSKAG